MKKIGMFALGLLLCMGLVACEGSGTEIGKNPVQSGENSVQSGKKPAQYEEKSLQVVYADQVPDNKPYEGDKEYTDEIRMIRYSQQGPSMGYSKKTIKGVGAHRLLTMLETLEPTGERAEKRSDLKIDLSKWELPGALYDELLWIQTEDGLYRIDDERNQFAQVQDPLGEGVLYKETAEIRNEISQLWSYYPRDSWRGTCEKGVLTLRHVYAAPTDESVVVKEFWLGEETYKIVLEVSSDCDQTMRVAWAVESGCLVGPSGEMEIDFKEGEVKTVPLEIEHCGIGYIELYIGGNTSIHIQDFTRAEQWLEKNAE